MPDLDNPKAKGTLMKPAFFLTGEELELGTRDLDRRTQLAEWITDSPWFSKSLVNRLWTDLVGSGFYSTVDDIGPERTCEHEETLDYLADEFEASGFDLKWLLQTIMATDVYQTASQSRIDDGSWSPTRNHPIRLRSDQLFNSVIQLFGAGAQMTKPERQRMQRRARLLFAANFGFDPSLPQDEISGSVPQALMLMNSEIIDRQLSWQTSRRHRQRHPEHRRRREAGPLPVPALPVTTASSGRIKLKRSNTSNNRKAARPVSTISSGRC